MNHVTFKTALALKAAGFTQPLPKLAQLWYFHSGDNAIVLWPKPEYGGLNLVLSTMGGSIYAGDKFNEIAVFAPTAIDIMKELGRDFSLSYMNGEWFVLKSTGDFLPISSEPSVWKHIMSAEAAAMAWLALNKKI